MASVLEAFHPVVAKWFTDRFGTPTEPQEQGWPRIRKGEDTLIAAPTGSGKTLAAFLACIDELVREGLSKPAGLKDETRVVYVSPLKALANDIRKNLEEPLAELEQVAAKMWVKLPKIRTAVRSGDTTQAERQAMLKKPPHILVTTPESLYLLLTSEGGREMLSTTRQVIVDEIHAIARDKRGAHLALSLERLTRLIGKRPARVGLSATQKPIEEIARFLVGTDRVAKDGRPSCAIVDAGHRRTMDIAVEVPGEELSAVPSKEMWQDVYDRVAALVREHASTLVFVNTRRMVERTTQALAERLGEEQVSAHHGSLSKETRLKAEQRLKGGDVKCVVATASLELGIDVGAIDLVVQLGSPRSFAVGLQRIGRAGHWRGAIPKGRIFPVSRDELIECAALVRGMKRGNLERTSVMPFPLDVLSQQLVAETSSADHDMGEDEFFALARNAWPYAKLAREEYDAIVKMLTEGFSTARGPKGAWLHRDAPKKKLRPRRGARLAALASGGAIPDNFTYAVVKEPEGTTIGSLDEDFAVESLAGDVFQLGNNSWRIKRVEMGRVRVEDAHGQPPNIPFWLGEAPGRSAELSEEVSDLRAEIEGRLDDVAGAAKWLEEECGLPPAGAVQAALYLRVGRDALGTLPTQKNLIAERFFDEGGGMQLIIHAPFGSRMNRAFGLALRKRFCQGFNFELQAAATDDGVLLSLGPQHSFPLESVFEFLQPETVQEALEQAVLAAPVFGVRWRWNATRSLVLLRQMAGKRVPPAIQRMRSDDLLAAAFPDVAACQEHVEYPIRIPDHPLVTETMRNCLYEAMDLESLKELLGKIREGKVSLVARDTPTPSPLSHEILNSNPYTYLDDAPLEERRARAVSTRRTLSEDDLKAFGALDAEAIESVAGEAWPEARDADELHDALMGLVLAPDTAIHPEWREWLSQLVADGRVMKLDSHVAVIERVDLAKQTLAGDEEAAATAVRGWMLALGPSSVAEIAARMGLSARLVSLALLRLEATGGVLRGKFSQHAIDTSTEEWCDRDLLARIHRRCLSRLRRELQPVTTQEFLRFLLRWQHVSPGSQLHGVRGLAEVIGQLEGMQLPAAAWEREVLPARVASYSPAMLDELCLGGAVAWGRLLGSRVEGDENGEGPARRASPNRNTTIALALRDHLPWLLDATAQPHPELGESAKQILDLLATRGAMFFNELLSHTARLRSDLDQALWELVAAGEVTCDGFAGLRTLIDPDRRREKQRLLQRYAHSRRPMLSGAGGRWSLLRPRMPALPKEEVPPMRAALGDTPEVERLAEIYLRRWGVVFRDLLQREPFSPPWRSLLQVYRRKEARGEIRGGRFVDGGFGGEQYALPEAIEALRAARKNDKDGAARISLSAADPLNLTGIVTPPPRVPATLANRIAFVGGVPVPADALPPRETLLV